MSLVVVNIFSPLLKETGSLDESDVEDCKQEAQSDWLSGESL